MYIIVIIIIIGIIVYMKRKQYTTPIVFNTEQETIIHLLNDSDGFCKSLNQWDLFARHVSSIDEYFALIKSSCSTFTDDEKKKLTQACEQADAIFTKRGDLSIASIPWKLSKILDSYEEGYPHTRSGVIMIPGVVDVKTLVHEKVHLKEKMNPPNLEALGYKRIGIRKGTYRLRSNPDVDEYIYLNPVSKQAMVALYTRDRPNSIGEVNVPHELEHPYEYLAYTYI
jgi:hypothetical protein